MAALTISDLKKAYGSQDLFEGVSFFVNERERAALVGANGTGKTTLLRIICGDESADAGSVTKEQGMTIGYLPQEVDLPDVATLHLAVTGVTPEILACAIELDDLEKKMHEAVGDEAHTVATRYSEVSHKFDNLGGFNYSVQAKAILQGLGFDESEFDKPIGALSGGQKTRAALARLLLLSPDMLLLDEPTNHLDIQATEWLQGFLNERYQGAALIVSHDRYFMDRVVSKVVELEYGTASTYPGNYSAFAKLKAERIEEQKKLYKEQQKEISRLEEAIQTLFSHRKFSRRDSKIKELERIQRVNVAHEQRSIKANLAAAVRSGRDVVRLKELTKSYPGKSLFENISFIAERGRKIGIVGPNGSGKTTLLKIIAERETADFGEVIMGHKVIPVYFAQEFDHLVPDRTVIEELLADADITSKQARDMLAQFLFLGDDAFKKVEVLSGGELCRLSLAKVLAKSPNLLLLDEPTNHLDIKSREALEDALRRFAGTVLVASHDRYLLDAIADEILEVKDGGCTHFLGNYSDYRYRVTQASESVSQKAVSKTSPEAPKRPMSSLREKERLLRDLGKRRVEIEHQIEESEAHMQKLTESLGDEENYRNGAAAELSKEYAETSERVESLYLEWEDLCERINDAEQEITG